MRRALRQGGFTLLEVMIAAALMSIVTAAAMAAYLAQLKLLNSQQQTSDAIDRVREVMRIVGNDVRSAAPGVGSVTGCPFGTVPFDAGSGTLSCVPPVFRSSSSLYYANAGGGPPYTQPCMGLGASQGYQLQFGAVTEPCAPCNPSVVGSCTSLCGGGALNFCPDDLVVVAVDDTSPLFLVSTPAGPSVANSTPLTFYSGNPTSTNLDGYGLDSAAPTPGELFLLQGAGMGAALLQLPFASALVTTPVSGVGGCSSPPCYTSYQFPLSTPSRDLFGGAQPGAVAMPARLTQYAIEPVNLQGQNVPPYVSANLVRSVVLPFPPAQTPTQGTFAFQSLPSATGPTLTSTTLVEGVLDLQVEFGIESPPGSGKLVYLSSGGLQTASWTPGSLGTPPTANANYNSCGTAGNNGTTQGLYPGVCFPNNYLPPGGGSQASAIANLRSVRLNLLVRSGTISNSRSATAAGSSAGVSAPFFIQPGVQDTSVGNVEAQSWAWTPPNSSTGQPTFAIPTADGAQYRQLTTEIFLRNQALAGNY